MTREQAKAWLEIFHKLRCNYYEQLNINCIQERGALARVSAFNVINKAVGHNGLKEHWEVLKHFADGGEIELYTGCGEDGYYSIKNPDFNANFKYRIKKKPFVVCGVECPEWPQTEPLKKDQLYYTLSTNTYKRVRALRWSNDCADEEFLKSGVVFLTKEGAESVGEAVKQELRKAMEKGDE